MPMLAASKSYSQVISSSTFHFSDLIQFFDACASNIRLSKKTFILYYSAINKDAELRWSIEVYWPDRNAGRCFAVKGWGCSSEL